MTFEVYLEYCICAYYSKINSKQYSRLFNQFFEEAGALYEFQNDNFQLKFINDRVPDRSPMTKFINLIKCKN
jgi:hypothetical protein